MSRIFAFLFFFALAFQANTLYAQCNPDNHCTACMSKFPDGFNFLKSFKIDGMAGQKAKVEYSYVLTKGTQYSLSVCTPSAGPDGIVMTLFDQTRNQIGSSKINNQFLSQLAFSCGATGIYYIQYTFEGSANYCGGSVLAYKR